MERNEQQDWIEERIQLLTRNALNKGVSKEVIYYQMQINAQGIRRHIDEELANKLDSSIKSAMEDYDNDEA